MSLTLRNFYDTNEAAERFKKKPATLRHSLCTKGHYNGIRPRKLPTGALLWPAEEVEAVIGGEATP